MCRSGLEAAHLKLESLVETWAAPAEGCPARRLGILILFILSASLCHVILQAGQLMPATLLFLLWILVLLNGTLRFPAPTLHVIL